MLNENENVYGNTNVNVNANMSRPLGITILAILVALGMVMNFIGGLSYLTRIPLYGYFDIGFAIVQLFIVIGFWNLKTWGWKIGVGAYIIDIIAMVLIVTTLADSFATQYGLSGSQAVLFKQILISSMFIPVIIAILVIFYIYSKRSYFTN